MVRGTRRGLTWGSRFLLANRRLLCNSRKWTGAWARTKWYPWKLLAGGFNYWLEALLMEAGFLHFFLPWKWALAQIWMSVFICSISRRPLMSTLDLTAPCLQGGGSDDNEHGDTVWFPHWRANMNKGTLNTLLKRHMIRANARSRQVESKKKPLLCTLRKWHDSFWVITKTHFSSQISFYLIYF